MVTKGRRLKKFNAARPTKEVVYTPLVRGVGVPLAQKVTLRYACRQTDTLDVGLSYIFGYVFRGNSAFDPDYTGVGSQPHGFDEWCYFYQSYTVPSSTIRVKASVSTAATTNAQIALYIVPTRYDALVSKGVINVSQMRKSKVRWFNAYTRDPTLSSTCSNGEMYPELVMTNNNFLAATNANPSFPWFWHVGVDGNSYAADTVVALYIEVDYYVIFEKPIELLAS